MTASAELEVLKARNPAVLGKRPTVFEEVRRCSRDDCVSLLSQYNRGPECWLHQPRRKYRVRGVLPSEEMEKESEIVPCLTCMTGNRGGVAFILDGVMHIAGEQGKATVCEE